MFVRGIPSKSQRGFSLVELLTVLAVMGLLAALSVPAMRSLVGADGLSEETGVVANLLTLARTQAISLRTPVQLRIVTNSWQNGGGTNDNAACYRNASLWELQQTDPNNPDTQTTVWKQLSAWQSIGPNIAFEMADPVASGKYNFTAANTPSGSYTYFLNSTYTSSTLTTGSPLITGSGPNVTGTSNTASMVVLEFLPTGALNTGATPMNVYLLLTEGGYNGSALTYSEKQSPMNNWAQVRVGYLTGSVSVVRP